jgi:Zn-dependent M28 family amino/carboxypeptidase
MRSSTIAVLATVCLIPASLWCAAHDFSGERALDYTRKAVNFGPRPPGSPAIKQLQAYITEQIHAHGATLISDDFTASTPKGPIAMRNLIARFPGTTGKAIVISGHYDTKPMPGFVGANDGGSSTGFLLEMLNVLEGGPRKDDVWLVWLDGEEAFGQWTATDSLYGSRHLAGKWLGDGTASKIKALINVDMIGDKNLDLVYDQGSSRSVRELIWQVGEQLGFSANFPRAPGGIEDDHQPFLKAGIKAVDIIDFDYGPDNSWWHNEKDSMDKLSANSLRIVGTVIQNVLPQIEAWP